MASLPICACNALQLQPALAGGVGAVAATVGNGTDAPSDPQ